MWWLNLAVICICCYCCDCSHYCVVGFIVTTIEYLNLFLYFSFDFIQISMIVWFVIIQKLPLHSKSICFCSPCLFFPPSLSPSLPTSLPLLTTILNTLCRCVYVSLRHSRINMKATSLPSREPSSQLTKVRTYGTHSFLLLFVEDLLSSSLLLLLLQLIFLMSDIDCFACIICCQV